MRNLIFLIYIFFYPTYGHDYSKNDIIIDHPILKINSSNSKTGAGYLKIINNSDKEITVIDIESKIAETQEIHEVILKNNVYKMRPLKGGIIIKPKDRLIFKAKSYHFMFFNIINSHEKDDMLQAKIIFNNGFFIPIHFKVVLGNENNEHNH